MNVENFLIFTGLFLILVGLLMKVNFFPLLPGDILIKKDNFVFYFPIVTSLIISLILTLIFHFFKR